LYAQIITDTAVTLGQAICRQQIVPLVQQLAQDPQFRIRKLCAICCGPLCEAVAGDSVQSEVVCGLCCLHDVTRYGPLCVAVAG
jgi:hypothetical protein